MGESCRRCWMESYLNQTAKAEGCHASSQTQSLQLRCLQKLLQQERIAWKAKALHHLFFSSYYSDMYVPNFTELLNFISL